MKPQHRLTGGQDKGLLLRRSTTVSLYTGLAVVAGFLADILVVSHFGLGSETDAYFGGYTIPFVLITTISAIQPVFVTVLAGYRQDQEVFSVLLNSSGLITVGLAIVGALLARPLIAVTTPGFAPDVAERATFLARVLYARVPASAIAEVCRAELYTRRRFGLATFSNALPSLVAVAFILSARPASGIEVAAYGFVVGSVAQALLLFSIMVGPLRMPYRWMLRHPLPVLRETGRLLLAPLAGLALRQAVTLAERILGSFLPSGSLTALSYADRLTMIIAGVFFDAFNRAALPSMATHWSRGQWAALRRGLETLLKLMSTLAFPAGLTVAALSTPLVRLFFEQGQVDYEAAVLMGSVLGVYSLSLPFVGPYRVVRTFFFAVKEAKPIVVLHGVLAGLTVALDLVLVWSLGAVGLAMAFAVSSGLVMVASLFWLSRWYGRRAMSSASHSEAAKLGIEGSKEPGEKPPPSWWWLFDMLWRLGLASGAMAVAEYYTSNWAEAFTADLGRWGLLLNLGLSGLVGLVVWLGLGLILRLEVISVLTDVIGRWRLPRRAA